VKEEFLALTTALLWGVTITLNRVVTRLIDPFPAAAVRVLASTTFFLLIGFGNGVMADLRGAAKPKHIAAAVVSAAIGLFIGNFLAVSAAKYTVAAKVGALTSTSVLISVAVASILTGDKPRINHVIAAILIVAGTMILTGLS